MNWADLFVVAVIVGFGIIGLSNGFVISVFRLASFLVSTLLSLKFYPVVSGVLRKTALYAGIQGAVYKSLLEQYKDKAPELGAISGEILSDTLMGDLPVPDFVKDALAKSISDPTKLINPEQAAVKVSSLIAGLAIDIISLILLYVLIRIGLAFVRFILVRVARLPVFRQIDRLGGFSLGALEGLLTVYILCAVLVFFQSFPYFKPVYGALENSTLARYFYENNFIVNWLLPGK